jgi:hypothetical protein
MIFTRRERWALALVALFAPLAYLSPWEWQPALEWLGMPVVLVCGLLLATDPERLGIHESDHGSHQKGIEAHASGGSQGRA